MVDRLPLVALYSDFRNSLEAVYTVDEEVLAWQKEAVSVGMNRELQYVEGNYHL
ncbi:MAG: hypothetical protein RRY39_08230 [Odoribacter sp.]